MRVLHVLSQEVLTGAEVYASALIDCQVQSGFQVFAVSTKFHIQFSCQTLSQPISSNLIKNRIKSISFLRRFIKANRIDVIHTHSRAAARNVFWATLGIKIAVVSTVHGRQHVSLGKKLFDIYGHYIIAICENVKSHLLSDFSMQPQKIQIIRNPVSPHLYKAITKDRPAKIAIIGRSAGPKGEKTKEICRQVFLPFLKRNPQIQLTLIASEPDRFGQDFLQEIKSYPQISIQSIQGKLTTIYNDHCLIVGAGRVAIEALFCETPVVALGEHTCHGLVNESNWNVCLSSNFGDIGTAPANINWQNIQSEIESFFSTQATNPQIYEWARKQFSAEIIFSEVNEVYKQALYKAHVGGWLPILMYHKIPDKDLNSKHKIFVTKDQFAKHLQFFKAMNFTTLKFSELAEFYNLKKSYAQFPKKPLILTFDDGYKDNLTNALPLLQEYQIKANFFLLANHTILENTWDAKDETAPSPLMNLQEKKTFAKSQMVEIGSHGFNHLDLTKASLEQLENEIKRSKSQLEKDLDVSICAFAYPFGRIDKDIWRFAKNAKYDFAVNTDQGGLTLEENRWGLFRVNVFPKETLFSLWKKTSSWYRKYFYLKRHQ